MQKLKIALALGMFGLLAGRASAQTATTYTYKYIAQQTAYTAPINSDLTINLYLQETNSDQSMHSLLIDEHGLTSAGIEVAFKSGDTTNLITDSATNAGAPPAGFDDPADTAVFTPTTATISEGTEPDPLGSDLVGVEAGLPNAGVSTVLLGTVKIHTSSAGGVLTTFSVGTTDSTIGATFTNDTDYDLDNNALLTNPAGAASLYSNALSTTFTVSTLPVPEPAMLSFAAPILMRLGTRRRKA